MELTFESAFSQAGILGHLAYVLLVASMLMRRMLWLRILVIASATVGVAYSTLILTDPVSTFWESLLILVNVGQLTLTWWLDRGARFDEDETMFLDNHFQGLRPNMARRLLRLGRWETMPADTVLTIEGQPVPALYYLHSGHATVTVGGFDVARSEPGGFVGDMTILTDDSASATVILNVSSRVWHVDAAALRAIAAEHPEIGRALEAAFFRMLRARLIKRNSEDSRARAHPYAVW
jgi:hypothetical protein